MDRSKAAKSFDLKAYAVGALRGMDD